MRALKGLKLRESWGQDDWLSDWLDVITRDKAGWQSVGDVGRNGNRHGRKWPLYRTEDELRSLRQPAEILAASNCYAIGLIDALTSYVIGTGFTYTAQVVGDQYPGMAEALQRVIDDFLLRNQWGGNDSGEIRLDCDRDSGEQPSLEEEAFKRTVVQGEFIGCSFPREDGMTDVRVIDPDQLTAPPSGVEFDLGGKAMQTNGEFDQWGFGVFSPPDDAQNPLAYWVQWGDDLKDGEVIGPDQITHVRVNAHRANKRGMTDFSFDTMDTLKLANTLRGNLGEGAAQQAAIAWVTQHQAGTASEIQSFVDSQADDSRTRPGTGGTDYIRRILRGEQLAMGAGDQFIAGPGAGNAAAHVAVLQALLRAAAVRWCGTEWLASGDASNNNYASSLVANNHFVIAVKRRQKALRSALGMMVARAVKHWLRTKGGLTVNGTSYAAELVMKVATINVTVPNPENADPLIQAQRDEILMRNKVIDPKTVAEKAGLDWDQIKRNWHEFEEDFPNAGTPLSVPPGFGGAGNVSGQ